MEAQTDYILIEQFLINHPEEAVRLIEQLKMDDIARLLDTLSDYLAALAIVHLNMVTSVNCLQMINIRKTVRIIEHLPLEIISVVIRNMPKDYQKLLLESIPQETSIFLNRALNYPAGTVGSIMDPFVYTLFEDISVADAMRFLKRQSDMNGNYTYILTRDHKLAGVISLSDLIRAKSNQLLGSIMNKMVVKILADVKHTLILSHSGWQEYHVLPVVDNNDNFQGILQYKILRHLEEGRVKSPVPQNLIKASSALGELYRIGITSLIQGASDLYNQSDKKT
jgi:magnesium transporter